MKQIKIKSYSENLSKCEEVALADNFFFRAYRRWNKSDNIGDDVIKCMMPKGKLTANDITINNINYTPYIATPNQQKKETRSEKCEFWYIKQDKKDFIEWFNNLISLGKLKQLKGKEICINKQVGSRLSLAFTSTEKINFNPKILVVKNNEEYILPKDRDYIYYTADNDNNLVKNIYKKDIKITQADGFGLMNANTANAIKHSLKLNYNVDFAICRIYGLSIKGLFLTFDFVEYAREFNNNNYIVFDAWDNPQDIRKFDMIVTTSQAKWWKLFDDLDDYNNSLKNYNNKDLVEKLYISRVNRDKPKGCSLTNYQLMSNLALTLDDYKTIAEPTYKLYNNIVNGDINSIRFFLKQMAQEEKEESDNEEEKEINNFITPSTKAEFLLSYNEEFYKLWEVKKTIKRNVLNQIAKLTAGKMYVKGGYRIIASCPITLMNYILGIKDDTNELKANEFYINGEAEKNFCISRNPLNNCWEVKCITTVKNEVLDKYCNGYTKELIFFNSKDSTPMQLSSQDFDGDGCMLIENDIVYNAVIENDKEQFIHISEGNTKNMIYNDDNLFKSLLLSAGNYIGVLALVGGGMSNTCLNGDVDNMKNNFENLKPQLLYLWYYVKKKYKIKFEKLVPLNS